MENPVDNSKQQFRLSTFSTMRVKGEWLSTIYSEEFYRGMWIFMGLCPKPHQGNDSLGTPFACGAGERNTPFTDYLFPQKRKLLQIGVQGNDSPARVLRDGVPEELFAYGVLFLFIIFRRNDSFCKSGQGGDPLAGFLGTASLRVLRSYDSLISFSNARTVFCKPSSLSSCFSIFEMA